AAAATITAAAVLVATAPAAGASAASFCGDLGGQWDGQGCHTTVLSERNATRDITMDLPEGFVDNPVIRNYLTTLMNNWRTAAVKMAADSYAKEHFWVFPHGAATTIVFNEIYSGTVGTDALAHPNRPIESTAYRTFTFTPDRQLALADIFKPGLDPNTEIPTRGEPFIMDALNAAAPPHQPNTYPFMPDRWTPNNVYSGGYKAWALTPDELILYMPDYPVGHDTPLDFTTAHMQWFMNGGIVQAHIPLSALAPVLRPEFGGN
ncbi:MAG TPA: mannan-binding family protein, partial [Mycobacterium sp.]|nr:mannan-binding family protein [Mycobacterium sp.]